jgi:thioredoxin 1
MNSSNQILTTLDKKSFAEILQQNTGRFIVKFGAEWCGPCKQIEGLVKEWMGKMPPQVRCAIIDVDDNFEIYAFLKSKRMVNGIPVILSYNSGNLTHIPNDVIVGADVTQINTFFTNILTELRL